MRIKFKLISSHYAVVISRGSTKSTKSVFSPASNKFILPNHENLSAFSYYGHTLFTYAALSPPVVNLSSAVMPCPFHIHSAVFSCDVMSYSHSFCSLNLSSAVKLACPFHIHSALITQPGLPSSGLGLSFQILELNPVLNVLDWYSRIRCHRVYGDQAGEADTGSPWAGHQGPCQGVAPEPRQLREDQDICFSNFHYSA